MTDTVQCHRSELKSQLSRYASTGRITALLFSLSIAVTNRAQSAPPGPLLGPSPTEFHLEVEGTLSGGISYNLAREEPTLDRAVYGWFSFNPQLRMGSPVNKVARWWTNLSAQIATPADPRASPANLSNAAADLRITLFATSPVTLNIIQVLGRTPSSPDLAIVPLDPTLDSKTSLEFRFGEYVVEGALGYDFRLLRHTDALEADRNEHLLRGSLAYRFGTHAELYLHSSIEFCSWPGRDDLSIVSDTMPIRTYLALEGYMTRHFWGRLEGGYAQVFGTTSDSFSSAIGEAAIGWDLETTRITMGFRRQLENSYWGHFSAVNRTYLSIDTSIGGRRQVGRVRLKLFGAYDLRVHGSFSPSNATISGLTTASGVIQHFVSHAERQGQSLLAELQLSIAATPWLAVTLQYTGAAIISNFRIQRITLSSTVNSSQISVWNWHTHLGQIGIQFFY